MMRKLILVFSFYVVLLITSGFSLEISPSLIYQIDTAKYQFTYEFYVKNDIPIDSRITIEIIDFITDGRSYSFDDPDYKYSLKKYVRVADASLNLSVNEQKPIKVVFDVPQNFPGAVGIFALKITQESSSSGKVQLRLNYIVPFFVRFTNVPVYQSVAIKNISVKDLLNEPDEKYGDYGSLITLEIENTGNIAFIPKGNMQISSKVLRTIITEVPIDSFDLVVFPERRTFYSVYIPYSLPSGSIDVLLTGKSYGQEFSISASKELNTSNSLLIIQSQPMIILFTEGTKNTTQNLVLKNLSPHKETLQSSLSENIFSFLPKKVTLYPYRDVSINIKSNIKDFNFTGDKIYLVEFSAESGRNIYNVSPSYVVLRGKVINPSLNATVSSSQASSVLIVQNTGDCILEFNVVYNNQMLNEKPLVIFPSQVINLDFGRVIRTSILKIEYSAYGEQKKYIYDGF
ncbi:hypothetical protein SAMN04488510_10410 [Fervidobacterium changbaicum]|uniref:Uncharacterized protein n=2 Tax=Fervidobacterium changbaicum TaxID=310769 RepID=A0ABX5QRZ2_9BACT|nr:hypothetical protein [Fervidobacterium changbaicum]QAV33246.1 hypothetical protein CBS1_05600 [Fervidobacterium changbaicum]SDH05903.1 hypothetical protein SAMN04488510_10410 [Fervidobacterium changbaicum]